MYGVLGYYYQLLITGRALGSCHRCHVSDEAEFCIGTVNLIKSLVIRSLQGSSTLLISLILNGNAVKRSFDDRFCWNQTCGCMHWIFCNNSYFTSINFVRPDHVEFIDELGQPITKEVALVTSSPIGWDFCSTIDKEWAPSLWETWSGLTWYNIICSTMLIHSMLYFHINLARPCNTTSACIYGILSHKKVWVKCDIRQWVKCKCSCARYIT